uniref:F-box associated domain-containing protein n=1 Tax=Setaria italica TaxID=4555 RepID=K3ZCZ1_SETIT
NSDISEDVICENIFSRLPFKLVTCLKTVSGHSCTKIINSAMFAAKQARLCPSCPALIQISSHVDSDGRYNYYLNLISSTPAIVGVPSSRLNFLGCRMNKYDGFSLLASTNGLLCIQYTPEDIRPRVHTILIANPATQQAQPIPGAEHHLIRGRAVGLVFDPPNEQASANKHKIKIDPPIELSSAKDNKFKIVQAFPFKNTNNTSVEFRFVTFSSDTGRWVMSSTTVNGIIKQTQYDKVVYASGVLYWDYQEDLLWCDVAKSAGGIIKMPWMLQGSKSKEWDHHSIDTSSDGILMCTTTGTNGLAIYQLVEGGVYWKLKHKKGWTDIIEVSGDAFQFCHSMKLRNGWQSRFYERWLVKPLGLESERWLYLGVTEKWRAMDMVLLRYDLDSGKVEDIGKGLSNRFDMMPVFGYRNSMAALPQIAEPISSGGICDGNPGRCICATKG